MKGLQFILVFFVAQVLSSMSELVAANPLKVLLIDGQNNHAWRQTSPVIKKVLEATGRFQVEVATTPDRGGDLSTFHPRFQDYAVVVSNYNGQPWSDETKASFEKYVREGGGFVSVHAADNSFPEWPEYNRMIGLGGWGGRNEKDGPYVRWRGNEFIRDYSPGRGGSHGRRHPFKVTVRDDQHPITKGLPREWMQAEDELYGELRGPAKDMKVLATAFSTKESGGTGEHEPILMVIAYGKGRVFHTVLGHDLTAMSGMAFQITLQRGTEWAATGLVSQPPVSDSELSADEPVTRDPESLKKPAVGPTDANNKGSPKTFQLNFDLPPDPSGDGWNSLFNGTDLKGWVQRNGTAIYTVEDQSIVGKTSVGSPNSFLCTEEEYEDFELSFEVNVDTGLNSGVQIRSRSLPEFNDGRVHGPQVEIESSPGEAGYIYSEATGRNWISKTQPVHEWMRNGQWNHFLIRAAGHRIQTWVNGTKIEDLVDPESFTKGFIGLQVHSIPKEEGPFQVRWRNIKLRRL